MKKHLLTLTSAAVIMALGACSDTKTVDNAQHAAPTEATQSAQATEQNTLMAEFTGDKVTQMIPCKLTDCMVNHQSVNNTRRNLTGLTGI